MSDTKRDPNKNTRDELREVVRTLSKAFKLMGPEQQKHAIELTAWARQHLHMMKKNPDTADSILREIAP